MAPGIRLMILITMMTKQMLVSPKDVHVREASAMQSSLFRFPENESITKQVLCSAALANSLFSLTFPINDKVLALGSLVKSQFPASRRLLSREALR